MSRTRAIPPIPEHVTDEAIDKRKAVATFRQAENKPEVVKPLTEGKAN